MTHQDPTASAYTEKRRTFWDATASRKAQSRGLGGAYHRRLAQVYRTLALPGQRVLELGCGLGDLLAAVEPSEGVGVDFSGDMIRRARARHPHLRFIEADAHALDLQETFDVIILSDLVGDLWDIQTVLQKAVRLAHPHTRILMNFYSRLWEQPLRLARGLGLATRVLPGNWLTVGDIRNLAQLAGIEVFRSWQEVLCPLPIPLVAGFCNRFLVRVQPLNHLAVANFVVARPQPTPAAALPSVSVVIPVRNEAGNVPSIFARMPALGRDTEWIFVEGHSSDDTYAAVERSIAAHPERKCLLLRQSGKGKGDAVRLGFSRASGDVLMILDADLTVPPEDLPRFLDSLCSGKGEFINGVRMVYPMEDRAMRFLNFLGNKFFTVAFSWVLDQTIRDTLCGTKVLWRKDYERIAAGRSHFGDFDPFGDFDLIFGAVRLNRRIVDMPIRYRERQYGTTNIQRWRHGWLLLRMLGLAARRIKFVAGS